MKEIRRLTLFCLLVVTVGFAAISFWYDLGGYALLDNNEGIYAQIAREMWESGNYVTPFFNGMPYLEKPPLLFWLTALSYQLFGVSEFAARVVPALSASLLFLLAIWSGWRLFNPLTGTLAGLILASSVTVAVLGRTLIFDMLMTLLLSAGLIWIYCWFDTQKRRFALLAAGALGLAVLTKGLLPLVLVGLAVVTFAVSVQMPLTTLNDWRSTPMQSPSFWRLRHRGISQRAWCARVLPIFTLSMNMSTDSWAFANPTIISQGQFITTCHACCCI